MGMLSFQDIVKISEHDVIVLCRGKNGAGEDFFHYIKTNRHEIERMHHDYADKKEVDFYSYGKVLHSGWGKNPSAADEDLINNLYKTL